MLRSGWASALTAAVPGVALGVVGLAGSTLVLYTGDGFLGAVGFLMALAAAAGAAGAWVSLRDSRRRTTRSRWTATVVAFAAATVFVELWIIASPELRGATAVSLLAVVFLVAEPAYVVGALLATLQARARTVGAGREGGGVGVPPAVAGLLGLAGGILLSATYVVPKTGLGGAFLLAAIAVAAAGQLDARRQAREPEEGGMVGKVVAITGVGGRGQLGYALAEAFLGRGARVVVAGRRPEVEAHAAELAARGEVSAVVGDLTTAEGADALVAAAIERHGGLDVLVNAAGGLTLIKPLADTELAEWNGEIARNATTAYATTRAALPALRERRGAVVNFTSPAAARAPASLAAYAAAKAAVSALTRAVALEERGRVRVNAVAPGMMDTEQNRATAGDSARFVTREQVADVVLFLAGEGAAGITGQVIEVPGETLE